MIRLIRQLGGEPSKATGGFYARALALKDKQERLNFLNRGQGWVARTIQEALPRIENNDIQAALREMHDSHLSNIELADALTN